MRKKILSYLQRGLIVGLVNAALTTPAQAAETFCTGYCANANTLLSPAQVKQAIARAVAEARARNRAATIAVVDRVGNVLAVFKMNGAADTVRVRSGRFNGRLPSDPNRPGALPVAGLEEFEVPSAAAAISKAVTGAYLSSEGNAFSTRTANQIVQESFNPGEIGQPSGPLFGVQFSQLVCGDLVQKGSALGVGPRPAPLGLSADPGGLPLYLGGTPVGGIGIIADKIYGGDTNIANVDNSDEELIAVAGTLDLLAPTDRRADRITAGGLLFRYTDRGAKSLFSDQNTFPSFSKINGKRGNLIDVPGFYSATDGVRRGQAFGQRPSGITPAKAPFRGLDAFVLSDGNGVNRYPPVDGALHGAQQLTRGEVTAVLQEAIKVANRARAQIRRPLSTPARVTVSVVDHQGTILGVLRTRDAPVFGIDVSLQKARTAAFFSATDAAESLAGAKNPVFDLSPYVRASQGFVAPPHSGALFADGTAFSNRAIGNLARPSFPDGVLLSGKGPLSKPYRADGRFSKGGNEWSIFNVGLQLDLVALDVLTVLQTGTFQSDCTKSFESSIAPGRLANGIQIFPGSVPIYKHGTLVGAVGVSGDGVDQDDMVSYLGLQNASTRLGGVVGHAPSLRRADQVTVVRTGETLRLRYVQCPVAPFIGDHEQQACSR